MPSVSSQAQVLPEYASATDRTRCERGSPRCRPCSLQDGGVKTEAFAQTRRDRKKVEMLFAHLKRILRLGRLRLRGPHGAQFEFTLAAIAHNLRRLAKLVARPPPIAPTECVA